MLKELGKWLTDIAKYLATAVLISALFRDIQEKSTILKIGVPSVVLLLVVGLLLAKEPKNKKMKQKKGSKQK